MIRLDDEKIFFILIMQMKLIQRERIVLDILKTILQRVFDSSRTHCCEFSSFVIIFQLV